MTDAIRSYGPGKFNTIVDAYVYDVSLDGSEEDISFESGQNYSLMRNGSTIFKDHDPFLESLNEAEKELLTSAAGVIIEERSDGIVSVAYYDTTAELDAAWAQIQSAYEAETPVED